MVSNQQEALNSSTNRNAWKEGLTCCRQPIRTQLRMTHPPISCFCFAVWILEVNNIITTVSTVSSETAHNGGCYRWSVIPFRSGTRCVMWTIWASPARTFLSLKTVSVALGVGGQRRGSGFRRGSTRAQGLRPRPARGEGIWRLGWSPRSPRRHRTTAPECSEPSSVPRLTRTPRKRPAGWAQLELNLLGAPDRCIIIYSRFYTLRFIICLLVIAPIIRQLCVRV